MRWNGCSHYGHRKGNTFAFCHCLNEKIQEFLLAFLLAVSENPVLEHPTLTVRAISRF
jgi:hypothetical protein